MDVNAVLDYSEYVNNIASMLKREYPIREDIESIAKKLRDEIERRYVNAIARGQFRNMKEIIRDSMRRLLEENNIVVGPTELSFLADSAMTCMINAAKPYQDSEEALAKLRQRGMSLCIVTNLDGDVARKMLISSGLFRYFIGVVSADVTGVPKPNRRIFQVALKKMRCKPSQVLVVGTSWEDILGGKTAGIKTILLTRGRDIQISVAPDLTLNNLSDLLKILGIV